MTILNTIGYEQATQSAMLDELDRAGVRLVVDTRAVTSSRRPGFSKRQLAAALDERGIAYVHLRGLGTPKEGRLAARAGKTDVLARIYARHLDTAQAREELDELAALVRAGRKLCLLCYERDPTHCHRSFIADRLKKRLDVTVEHLFCTRCSSPGR
jgi:uncharacterized protein (DUF488 family)